eukprot:SAG31_NODE_33688_length_341_cov_0.632231_1_plen_87_part_01
MPEYDRLSSAGDPLGPPKRDPAAPGHYTREYQHASVDVWCAVEEGQHSKGSITYKTDDNHSTGRITSGGSRSAAAPAPVVYWSSSPT